MRQFDYITSYDWIDISRSQEIEKYLHLSIGVDVEYSVAQCISFELTDSAGKSLYLSVRVADAYVVHVDQSESSDPTSRQGLHAPRSHSTKSNDTNMSVAKWQQSCVYIVLVQTSNIRESLYIVIFQGGNISNISEFRWIIGSGRTKG